MTFTVINTKEVHTRNSSTTYVLDIYSTNIQAVQLKSGRYFNISNLFTWWGSLRERGHWGDPRSRWEDNIKMDLQEVGGGRGDWMELAQDRDGWRSLVGTVRNFRVP